MVGTAFFASLKREEGKPITFSLALITEQEINDVPNGSDIHKPQVKMKFPNPLPLTVEAISKLSMAFDKNCTAFAIEVSKEDVAIYQIWGAIYFDKSKFDGLNFEYSTVGGPGLYTQIPECFMIKATSAGSLTISFGNHNMGYFENGQFTQAVPTPFSSGAIQPYIERVFRENKWFDMQHWHYYNDSLKKILFEAADREGGGTVIFVPPSKVAMLKPHFKAIYSFSGDLGISFLLNYTIEAEKDHVPFVPQLKAILGRRLRALSQLSSLDGALIITSEWEMVGFGAKLAAPKKWSGNIVVGPNAFNFPTKDTEFDRSRFGTRHNSAIDFVGAFSGVIAFVISEDGPIRGFVKRDEETVLCWKDLRTALVS